MYEKDFGAGKSGVQILEINDQHDKIYTLSPCPEVLPF